MKVTHIAGVKRTVGEGMRVERHCANALAQWPATWRACRA